MTKSLMTPMCCGMDAKWVDNGPKLSYFYCGECRNEVLAPMAPLEEPPKDGEKGLTKAFEYLPPNDDVAGLSVEIFCGGTIPDKYTWISEYWRGGVLQDLVPLKPREPSPQEQVDGTSAIFDANALVLYPRKGFVALEEEANLRGPQELIKAPEMLSNVPLIRELSVRELESEWADAERDAALAKRRPPTPPSTQADCADVVTFLVDSWTSDYDIKISESAKLCLQLRIEDAISFASHKAVEDAEGDSGTYEENENK